MCVLLIKKNNGKTKHLTMILVSACEAKFMRLSPASTDVGVY